MLLVAIGSVLNSVAAVCWKIIDFLQIDNEGTVNDVGL